MLNARRQSLGKNGTLAEADVFRALLEELEQVVFVHRDFRPLFVNQACADTFGYATPAEVLRLAPAELRILLDANEGGCAEGTAPRRYEYQVIRQDNSPLWLEFTVRQVAWTDGPAMLCVGVDISDRKKAQLKAIESSNRLQLIAEQLPTAIAYLDIEGRYGYVTKTFESWCNRPTSEILGRTVGDIIGLENEAIVWPYVEAALAGMKQNVEQALTYPDGRTRNVSLIYAPDINELGEVQGCIILANDVTEHRGVEDALSRSERRSQEIIANHRDAILIVDQGGTTRFANPAAEQILGRTADRLIGTQLGIPLSGEDVAEVDIAGSPMRKAELQAVSLEWNGSTSFLVSLRDITERKAVAENERQLRAQLTHAARLSTVGNMATGLAHEINQPLTAISAYVQTSMQLLRAGDPRKEEIIADLEKAVQQVGRASEVVKWLRSVVKKEEIEKSKLHLNAVIQEVAEFMDAETRARNVEILLQLHEPLPQIEAHKVQIQQVLLNLIQNSLDAISDQQNEKQQILVCSMLAEPGHIRIEVIDAGPGISEEVQAEVFSAFFTTKPTGLGLGLSISNSIIEHHDGQMNVTSSLGAGTTFAFTLPIVREA